MTEHFPALSHDTLAAANLIGDWLSQDDLPQNAQPQIAVLAGNAVIPTIDAACRLAAQRQIPLLISGGIGHSTTFLYDAVQKHPHYQVLQVEGVRNRISWRTSPNNSGKFRAIALWWKTVQPTAAKTRGLPAGYWKSVGWIIPLAW